MDKRYQVFVSSTYEDLREERQEVMQALLELDCIPAGMELFPAATEDQWTVIKKVIDDCDYYIVIIGGRYGSLGSDGIGYTEKEYRYAVERKIPIIAFLHEDPNSIAAGKTDQDDAKKRMLGKFRELAQQRMCKQWSNPSELGSVVSRSVVQLIKRHPAIGWIRADQVASEDAMAETVRLQKRLSELEEELAAVSSRPPEGSSDLSQGDDPCMIDFEFRTWGGGRSAVYEWDFTPSWDQVFASIAPIMMNEAQNHDIRLALNKFIHESQAPVLANEDELKKVKEFADFKVADSSFHTIMIQLKALGLVTPSLKPKSLKDKGSYWTLTKYGETVLTQLRAIRRDNSSNV